MKINEPIRRRPWFLAAWITGAAALQLLAGSAPAQEAGAAKAFVQKFDDDILKQFDDKIQESYPFGRSSKEHNVEIERTIGTHARTKEWTLFNKHYLFDGDWFSVQWFYSAVDVKTGFKQIESTLAFGRVQGDKLIVWEEFFDDLVGELEAAGEIPVYQPNEEPFPWPAGATRKHPYRP